MMWGVARMRSPRLVQLNYMQCTIRGVSKAFAGALAGQEFEGNSEEIRGAQHGLEVVHLLRQG